MALVKTGKNIQKAEVKPNPTVKCKNCSYVCAYHWHNCTPWSTKMCYFIFHHDSRITRWTFTLHITMETGMNTEQS